MSDRLTHHQLTHGTATGRPRRKVQPGSTPEYVRLRALTARAANGDRTVAEDLREQIRLVGSQRTRMRFGEGAPYNDACKALFDLTGEAVGPMTATLPEPGESVVPDRPRVEWDGRTVRKDRTDRETGAKKVGPTHAHNDPSGLNLTWCGRRVVPLSRTGAGTVEDLTCDECKRAVAEGRPQAWGTR